MSHTITLRPYQEDAAYKLRSILVQHRIAYLRGAVRTGKTLTALRTVQLLGFTTVLIVTKKKAIASIQKDAEAIGVQATVTNFEQLPKYKGHSFGLIVVDEAHGVGAYPKPSKRWKDIRAIHYGMVLLMSGTPSPESYSQLYHQFALGPAPWSGYRTFYQWAGIYVNVRKKYVGTGQQVNDYSDAKATDILRDIAPLTVTVTQADAGFETQVHEVVHLVRMKSRTYRMAKRIMTDGVIGKPGRRVVLADSGAKVMSKVQQIWGGAVITEHHGAIAFDDTKARWVAEKFAGTKHAILYKFNAEGDMLKAMYRDRWTDSPEVFNADPNKVFVGQVQASREGVNLSSAEHLVFVGIDYSALSYLQGIQRASYLGRTEPPQVHWVFAEGGMEPKVYDTVRAKEDFTLRHFKRYGGR